MSLVNALVLDNICKYRHKSYIAKTRFFGLYFRSRQHGSIFIIGADFYRAMMVTAQGEKLFGTKLGDLK